MSEDVTKNDEMASTHQNVSEVAESQTDSNQDVDYKAELERLQAENAEKDKRIDRAERAVVRLKKESGDTEIELEETINKLVDEKVATIRTEVQSNNLKREIENQSSNPDEAELIRYHLDNSVKSTGDVVQDVLNAKAIANRARSQKVYEEVERAANAAEADKATTAGEKPQKPKSNMSAADREFLRKYGVEV